MKFEILIAGNSSYRNTSCHGVYDGQSLTLGRIVITQTLWWLIIFMLSSHGDGKP